MYGLRTGTKLAEQVRPIMLIWRLCQIVINQNHVGSEVLQLINKVFFRVISTRIKACGRSLGPTLSG